MPTKNLISWEEFNKVDLRVGTIVKAYPFPASHNPSYKLEIDFGKTIGIKKTAAQITVLYQKEELVGKQVIAVINFPKKQIANFMSECLVLGAVQEKKVHLLQPGVKVENGNLIN
ncbi:MAG: tRNA-binding protein [Flavobacteriales bacterium]